MRKSIRKIKALVKKEFIDFTRNNNISVISLLPLILVIILGTLGKNNDDFPLYGMILLSLGINMNLVFVAAFAMSMMISEEKEKQTLRTLMLSSVKPMEFIISKAVIIFAISIVTNAFIYVFTGLSMDSFLFHCLICMPLVLIMMLIGACVGMIAKNQMATSIYGMPVILIFMLLPLFQSVNPFIDKIVNVLPNQVILSLIETSIDGTLGAFPWRELFILVLWLLFSTLLFIFTFNKRKVDY